MNDDRTVHGKSGKWEIVRYDRAGKWWIELTGTNTRTRVTVDEAARSAARGEWFPGKPGGRTFDARVRRLI